MVTSVRYDFTGQVAIVTGGALGIGQAIARKLSDAGASVHVWDLRQANFEGVHGHVVDVTDPGTVATATAAILEQHGQIDILCNNAGFVGSTGALVDTDPAEWRRVIDVNLFGCYEVCRLVVPHMLASGRGRIVNMASLAGKEGTANASAYSAAKAGIIALTKSLAKELAQTEIRVNAIAPAAVETAILEQMAPSFVATMIEKSPMKRLGRVEEVANLAAWLCSQDCSFSTGAVFDLSGGRATY